MRSDWRFVMLFDEVQQKLTIFYSILFLTSGIYAWDGLIKVKDNLGSAGGNEAAFLQCGRQ